MKKSPPAVKLEDNIAPAGYHVRSHRRGTKAERFHSKSVEPSRRRVNYVTGDSTLEEPPDIPRLFVRGRIGGSIKLDLGGLGVALSEASFGHGLDDDSLASLGIYRGDIAFIDPLAVEMQNGNLVLFELDGRPVLRILEKENGVWYGVNADTTNPDPVPLWSYPLLGIVVGIIRMFREVKAVAYRGTEANFKPNYELSPKRDRRNVRSNGKDALPTGKTSPYRKRKHAVVLLAGEQVPSPLGSKPRKKPLYSGRAKTR